MLREFVKSPGTIGAIAPSSTGLSRTLLDGLDWERARVVVECGPGTGAVTPHILERLSPGAHFFAVELSESCARTFRERFPDVPLYQACVSQVPDLCREAGLGRVDLVVSGLPWAAFTAEDQARLLSALHGVLHPGGHFVTFAYRYASALPKGRRFRRLLEETFVSVERSPTVWLNLPPAFVYRCRS